MRASDADRDRVADQIREALAEGRLTPDEHAERLEALYQARTYAELVPIVEDLPVADVVGPQVSPPVARDDRPAPVAGSPNITAVLSGAERKGRWLVEPQTNVVAVMAGVELDLCEAVLSKREVTMNIVAIMSGVNIVIPPGVRVVSSITAVLGNSTVPDDRTVGPDAPVLRLTGVAMLGDVTVKRRATDTGRSKSRADRIERRERRRGR